MLIAQHRLCPMVQVQKRSKLNFLCHLFTMAGRKLVLCFYSSLLRSSASAKSTGGVSVWIECNQEYSGKVICLYNNWNALVNMHMVQKEDL